MLLAGDLRDGGEYLGVREISRLVSCPRPGSDSCGGELDDDLAMRVRHDVRKGLIVGGVAGRDPGVAHVP